MPGRILIAREWRIPKIFISLLIIEFPLTVACLTLMGIAHPNTYRTKLWQNGFDCRYNSSPASILYDYANYRPVRTPIIWRQSTTEFNVVISVLSMFFLLAKSAMYTLHFFIPLISVLVHAMLVAVYCVSIYNQSQPDNTDLAFPRLSMPWYLVKGCGCAEPGNAGYCEQARASFAVVVVMALLFAVYLGYSIWCCFPTDEEKAERFKDRQSAMEMKKLSMYASNADLTQDERREINRQVFLNLPKTPNTPGFGMHNPMTPRTVAFTQLNGGVAPNPKSAGPSRALPFRDYPSPPPEGE